MLLSAFLAATLAVSAQQPAATRPAVTITRAATPPQLEDFRTGERRDGLVADAFLQREPGDLVPSTERTEAYLCTTPAIYTSSWSVTRRIPQRFAPE